MDRNLIAGELLKIAKELVSYSFPTQVTFFHYGQAPFFKVEIPVHTQGLSLEYLPTVERSIKEMGKKVEKEVESFGGSVTFKDVAVMAGKPLVFQMMARVEDISEEGLSSLLRKYH